MEARRVSGAGGVGGLLPGGAALWVDCKLSHVADAIGRSACPASKQGFEPLRRPKARVVEGQTPRRTLARPLRRTPDASTTSPRG